MVDIAVEDGIVIGFAVLIWTIVTLVAAICIKLVSIQKSVNTIRDARRLFKERHQDVSSSETPEDQ